MQRIIVVTLLGVFVSLFPILSAYATTCEPNQYLDNGFCYTCPANATCDGTNFTCANGWYKNGGICQRCSVENSSCTGPDDYSCLPGFYDDNGTCAACPENATCPGGTTFTCNRGYVKNADGTGCTKMERICLPGQYRGEDGECKDCPSPGTSSRNASGITSCYIPSGYTGSDTSGSYEYAANCYYK